MYSLDRMLKRTRSSPKDIKTIHYDGTTQTLDAHHDPSILSFSERTDNPEQELQRMQDIHDLLTPNIINNMPLDPHIKCVVADKRIFPVYILNTPFVPTDMAAISQTAAAISSVIETIHEKGWVLWNIHEKAICINDAFSPQIIFSARQISAPRTNSIIMGSTIVSPYQVLCDILSSKYECDEIPYETFKTRFMHFWGRVLPPPYRHVPDVCQFYYEMYHSSSNNDDYVDSFIKRWCVISDGQVIKDPSKLLNDSEMLFKVDWFAFVMVLDMWIEQVVERDPSASPTPDIMKHFKNIM